ncbi:hypothetical protein [Longitalea luteola]|uniref:hypothetical protein n=1 Tax=Longitalea luteola TaxID=2812563 RepID=UPI001A974DED|nr:hypothetical protein [Longitalea luteola]
MKRLFSLLTILSLFTVSACKKDGIKEAFEYRQSYSAWQQFKETTGNSYTYEVVSGSWIGLGYYTTITVKAGKVTERKYILKGDTARNGTVAILREWVEDESQVGSHTADAAAPAVTLDDIYARAKNEWLAGPDDADYFFETENDGMISTCGYVPHGCADDCFRGIHISYIRSL